jgi:hypothetical protein
MQSIHEDLSTSNSHYKRWAAKRRACPHLLTDAAKAANSMSRMLKDTPTRSETSGPRRGRPVLSTENPLVNLIPLLSLGRPQWFDDIVCGSIATSAGTSQGRLNVRPGQVFAALHLRRISVAALGQQEQSCRGLQAVAQAARHTLRGLEHYLHRHPQVKELLEAEAEHASWIGN